MKVTFARRAGPRDCVASVNTPPPPPPSLGRGGEAELHSTSSAFILPASPGAIRCVFFFILPGPCLRSEFTRLCCSESAGNELSGRIGLPIYNPVVRTLSSLPRVYAQVLWGCVILGLAVDGIRTELSFGCRLVWQTRSYVRYPFFFFVLYLAGVLHLFHFSSLFTCVRLRNNPSFFSDPPNTCDRR